MQPALPLPSAALASGRDLALQLAVQTWLSRVTKGPHCAVERAHLRGSRTVESAPSDASAAALPATAADDSATGKDELAAPHQGAHSAPPPTAFAFALQASCTLVRVLCICATTHDRLRLDGAQPVCTLFQTHVSRPLRGVASDSGVVAVSRPIARAVTDHCCVRRLRIIRSAHLSLTSRIGRLPGTSCSPNALGTPRRSFGVFWSR